MGAGSSVAQVFRKDNPRLKLFVSGKSIPSDADSQKSFFTSLLEFDIVNAYATEKEIEEIASDFCKSLAKHNTGTRNLNKLVQQVVQGLQTVPHDCRLPPQQVQNGLFLLRVFLKHIVETDGSSLAIQLDGDDATWYLLKSLIDFAIDHTVSEHTYMTHSYCMQTLLVLLSPQMFLQEATSSTTIIHTKVWRAPELMQTLLLHFIHQRPRPVAQPQTGLLHTLSSAASFILQLPFHAYTFLFTRPATADVRLGDTALLLLLALVVQSPPNPYRIALISFQDSVFDQNDPEAHALPDSSFRLPLADLYNVITFVVPFDDRTILLLYYLLHGNPLFLSYVQSRTDLDTLLLPLLHILYHSFEQKPQQIYMILIIILILSQDESFSKSVHQLMLPTVSWYKERYLVDISLGGFIILVLIRTVQLNFTKLRDVYLHTNCLATLANISANVTQIHPFVANRLVKLFEMLSRKYTKISKQLSALQPGGFTHPIDSSSAAVVNMTNDSPIVPTSAPATLTNPTPTPSTSSLSSSTDVMLAESTDLNVSTTIKDVEALNNEYATFEDFLHIVLTIIHHTLMHNMWQNPQLVYTMLHESILFPPFLNHPRFGNYVGRIVSILQIFEGELAKARATRSQQEWTAEAILECITRRARTWKNSENEHNLNKSASMESLNSSSSSSMGGGREVDEYPLQFRYEEEHNCAEFFIPYVWCIVYNYSGLIWNTRSIKLFSLKPPEQPAIFEEVMDVVFDTDDDVVINDEHQIKINEV